MSNVHKNQTISFRPSPYERKEIEARIKASGLSKKIFYTRSCLYDRICVVGKKETILPLVDEVELLYHRLLDLEQNIISFDNQKIIPKDVALFQDEINELQEDFTAMLKALISLLDDAKYLWESKEM
ncbi:plasmid mobilization protein [Jutongia sp. SJQ-6]